MVIWVHWAETVLSRCAGTSTASKRKEKTLLHSEPSPRVSQRDETPLIPATSTCWRSGPKYETYSPCWVGCTNWQAWNERHALVARLWVSTCPSDQQRHQTPNRQFPDPYPISCCFTVSICKAGTRKAYTCSQQIWISTCVKTRNKQKKCNI